MLITTDFEVTIFVLPSSFVDSAGALFVYFYFTTHVRRKNLGNPAFYVSIAYFLCTRLGIALCRLDVFFVDPVDVCVVFCFVGVCVSWVMLLIA